MREQMLLLQKKLNEQIKRAECGEISFDDVAESINIRELLPPHKVLATTWHIDDLRGEFPEGTPDDVLIRALQDQSSILTDSAVLAGNEIIQYIDFSNYIPSDELATCGQCGETKHENEINMIDYDIDICSACEEL